MKLIVLDRDGVINQDSADGVRTPEEWIPIPGSLEAIARLSHAGYRVVVVTNQSGIGRGRYDIETLHRIHQRMHQLAQEAGGVIDAVFFCPETADDSPCRKPNPGMLEDLGRRLKASLRDVPVVGDSIVDVAAARAVDARPILVRTGKGERTLAVGDVPDGVAVFADLAAVASHLLAQPD